MTSEELPTNQPVFQQLPGITLRQLEVFHVVCRERSYANAALELRSGRANIKRVCQDFEAAVGRALFVENADRTLEPTAFAMGLLGQAGPLSRGLRRLGENVRSLHEKGRILRFAATGEFFKGGPFTDFLARLKISDAFRPCFLRIETKRHRTALLNVECDVYFGVGLGETDRLDCVDLGPIPWKIQTGPRHRGGQPAKPADLKPGKWWIVDTGDAEVSSSMLDVFHKAGAKGGKILTEESGHEPAADETVFIPDLSTRHAAAVSKKWPCHRFSAVLRKNHPYSELLPRLKGAALS
jgi:DNA-binding transcriptional LysR family regulator